MKNRTLLMIPGPIEFDPAVLAALGGHWLMHASQFTVVRRKLGKPLLF